MTGAPEDGPDGTGAQAAGPAGTGSSGKRASGKGASGKGASATVSSATGSSLTVSSLTEPEGLETAGTGPEGPLPAAAADATVLRRHLKGDAASEAVYSACERYRYLLTRTWDPAGRRALFVMLNPSTATELQNDPTVERCERRARALGFGAFRVTNIFAWRDTDPRLMRAAADPVGPGNDAAIRDSAPWADTVVAAWGTHGAHLGRGAAVEAILRATGTPLHVLGLTRDGHPMHPLYIAYDRQPVPWPPA